MSSKVFQHQGAEMGCSFPAQNCLLHSLDLTAACQCMSVSRNAALRLTPNDLHGMLLREPMAVQAMVHAWSQ